MYTYCNPTIPNQHKTYKHIGYTILQLTTLSRHMTHNRTSSSPIELLHPYKYQPTHDTQPYMLFSYKNCCILATNNRHMTDNYINSYTMRIFAFLQLPIDTQQLNTKIYSSNNCGFLLPNYAFCKSCKSLSLC